MTHPTSERLLAELVAVERLIGAPPPVVDIPLPGDPPPRPSAHWHPTQHATVAAVLAEAVDDLDETIEHAEDVLARRIPAGARRRLLPHERAAGVLFADLDAAQDRTAERIASLLDDARERYADALTMALTTAHERHGDAGLADALAALTDPQRIGVNATARTAIAATAVETAVLAELVAHHAAAVLRLADEARAQGVSPAAGFELPASPAQLRARAAQLVRDALAPVDTAAAGLLLGATRLAEDDLMARLARTLTDVATTGSATRRADARAAAQQTEGAARVDVAENLAPIRNVYASELLDRNTCSPCFDVDGTTYATLTDARVDYPGGTYIECEGGLRCRGTLVIVWKTETAPTLDNPGDQPPPAPRPRGPRRPRDPNPIPAVLDVSLDPISTAPPPVVEHPLTELSDDDLAALFQQAAAADDDALVDRIAAELDRRDALDQAARDTPSAEVDVEAARIRLRAELDEAYRDEDGPRAIRLSAELDALDPPDENAWQSWDEQPASIYGTAEERHAAEEAADDYLRSLGADVEPTDVARARREEERAARRQAPRGRLRDRLTAEWQTYTAEAYMLLETSDEVRGVTLRKDRAEEFRRKYGTDVPGVLFGQPMRVAAYYASEEVRKFWQADPNRRLSLAQYLRANGIRDRKTLAAAATADSAFDEELLRAQERGDRRRRR